MKALLTRLDRWLVKHRRRFHAGLLPGATSADIAALEKNLACPIPTALAELLAWHNGQRDDAVGKFEEDWQLMGCAAIAAAKEELDANAAANGWRKIWLPFLDDDAGDYVFLDITSKPMPVLAFWLGNKQPEELAPDLESWLREFVSRVEKGHYHEDPERGTFMRSDN